MLLADGRPWTLLHNISSTQYLNYEDTKFSKSRGVGVFGNNAAETGQPASVWRYYLLSQRPETGDTSFQWSKFIASINNELLNNLGNFVNRVVKFTNAKFDSIVPGPPSAGGKPQPSTQGAEWAKLDEEFFADIDAKLKEYRELMDGTKLRGGLATAMSISARGNQYLQDAGLDNALLANHRERCAEVILNGINLVYVLSVIFHPFMPSTSTDMLNQLNAPARSLPETFTIDILPGHKLGKAAHLFKRIEDPEAQEAAWQKQFGGTHAVKPDGEPIEPKEEEKPKGVVNHTANWAKSAEKKKAAAAAAQAAKSPEERDLEAKLEAQNLIMKNIRTGRAEGNVEEETAKAKALKADLAALRKKLKAAKI